MDRYIGFMERNFREKLGIGPVTGMVISALGFGFFLALYLVRS